MASNTVAATPSTDNQTDNVSIRVIALAHATNQNEDAYLTLNIDSTIAQLKDRLHETLTQSPRPESQRLIYHGRPLTNNNATLRQVLRTEPVGSNQTPAHVLHLVIRDDRSPTNSSANQPQSVRPVPPSTNPTANPPPGQMPTPPNIGFPQQAFAPVQSAQAMLQNQLSAIQQHLTMHNQHLQHNHQIPNMQHGPPHMPGPHLHPFPGRQGPGTPTPAPQDLPSTTPPMPATGAVPTNPAGPQIQANGAPPNFHGAMNVRVEETIGPNGERIRRVTQSGPLLPGHNNPVERSFSAPGFAPRPGTPGRFPAGPFPPMPMGVPGMPPQIRLPNPLPGSALMMPSAPARNPTLWLLSSPSGPEALLFAPQHGYFSTQQQTTAQSNSQPNANAADSPAQPTPSTPTPTVPPQDDTRGANQGQVALRPQHPAQEPAPAPPARREGEDVLAVVLQRGWLFLRLYMFIFVLSEAGTWRRYILLTIASLVCLLPRNNPFTDMFQAARQHFDNLIGPPQLPANAQGQQQPANRTDENRTADGTPNSQVTPPRGGGGAQMPTPEEHARRLLREHEQQNPNFIRDTLYRIEQAVALFLASLIPGVGERHVRAREEARRVVQEEERRRREEEERAQQESNDTSVKSDSLPSQENESLASAGGTAVSTSVDTSASSPPTTGTDDGVRMRVTDNTT